MKNTQNIEWYVSINFKENGKYKDKAIHNIIKLLKRIQQKCKKNGKKYIVFIDEIMVDFDCLDFSALIDLEVLLEDIDLLWAFNPAAFDMTHEYADIKFPLVFDGALVKRLRTKYRNSLQIAILLLHVNHFFVGLKEEYKCLPATQDNPLDPSFLISGELPLWIDCQNPETTIEEVLDFVLEHVGCVKPFTILYSVDQEQSYKSLLEWCQSNQLNNWKVMSYWDMTGSEADNVIAIVEDATPNLEVFSRARKNLVIVTIDRLVIYIGNISRYQFFT